MFSRTARRMEHKSFADFPTRALPDEEASGVSNIVILNSLTHDQLLDLLKAISLAPPLCRTSRAWLTQQAWMILGELIAEEASGCSLP